MRPEFDDDEVEQQNKFVDVIMDSFKANEIEHLQDAAAYYFSHMPPEGLTVTSPLILDVLKEYDDYDGRGME